MVQEPNTRPLHLFDKTSTLVTLDDFVRTYSVGRNAYDNYSAKMAREHNDANVLCLRGRNFSDAKNLQLVKIWLNTEFSGARRHIRRIRKIVNYEK